LLTLNSIPDQLFRELYETDVETTRDHSEYTGDDQSYEEFARAFSLNTKPMAYGIALDGDRICGFSTLELPTNPGEGGYTGYTCMRRAYRGRGITRAVKLLTIEVALAKGIQHMRTTTNPANIAMLKINERLGYQMLPNLKQVKKQAEIF